MHKESLTVILATHNEESRLARCLEAVASIANEIIIADGESTDRTVQIANTYGARVISLPNVAMFHTNKVRAAQEASGDWILYLDADEIVSPALSREITAVLEGTHPSIRAEVSNLSWLTRREQRLFRAHMHSLEHRDKVVFQTTMPVVAFFLPRKNFFLGSYLMHSGVYPDGVIRLVRRGKGEWPCVDVHETMRVDGGVSWLSSPLIHEADPTFSRYLYRAARYTALTADSLQQTHKEFSIEDFFTYVFTKPMSVFSALFFRHRGFLDGYAGFIWALLSAFHFPIAYFTVLISQAEKQKKENDRSQ